MICALRRGDVREFFENLFRVFGIAEQAEIIAEHNDRIEIIFREFVRVFNRQNFGFLQTAQFADFDCAG